MRLLDDLRGQRDAVVTLLEVTAPAVGDEIAAGAPGARRLVRPAGNEKFSLGSGRYSEKS